MNSNQVAPFGKVILLGIVGSTAHGLNVGDAIEDRDEMGVMIEPIRKAIGFTHAPVGFEQYIYRSAAERTGVHNEPSVAGDLDRTVYSLRKYLRLLLKGNPTTQLLLYTNPLIICNEGQELQDFAPYFVTKKVGRSFLEYMDAQLRRFQGQQGGAHGAPREKLVKRYGYDTKYACHIVRLGMQGLELMNIGRLNLPMLQSNRELCLKIREGQITREEVIEISKDHKELLTARLHADDLPEFTSDDQIKQLEDWMIDCYHKYWNNPNFGDE